VGPEGRSGEADEDPGGGRRRGLDYRSSGAAVGDTRPVPGRFYPLGEYLSAAAATVAPEGPRVWRQEQQDLLKENRWPEVLDSLRPFGEGDGVADGEAPVRAGHRYLTNHAQFLDDRGAIAADLPIGSGEIESAHRYVIQIRLKIAGAWWKVENLSKMLALRVLRANRGWEDYWRGIQEKAA